MHAFLTEHGTLSIVSGTVGTNAIPIPEVFWDIAQNEPGRLVWTGSAIEDAASIQSWWIAPDGTRRAYRGGDDWVKLSGAWDSRLTRNAGGAWILESASAGKRRALHDFAARQRFRKETAGVAIAGMTVPTDERTQAVLTGAYVRAKADSDYAIAKWKVGPGQYVALSNEQIIAIGEAVAAHIQTCFDLNAEIDDKIEAGEITVEAQIEGLFAAA